MLFRSIVIAFSESAVDRELTEQIKLTLPDTVRRQLALVINPDWDTAQTMTIGPKFAPTDPKPTVAMDFHDALNKLAVVGPLRPDSVFVSSALKALSTFMAAPESMSLDLSYLEKAAPGLESEVAAAMRISLQ